MSKRMTIKALLFAGALVLAVGCGKDVLSQKYPRNAGDPVVFGVSSSSEVGDTRTAYREVTSYPTRDGKKIQPIDWVVNDMIRVYSPDCKRISWQSQPQQWSDYTIKSVEATGENNTVSKGELIANVQDNGLAWSDAGNHTFYAIYPSPNTTETDVPDGATGVFAYTIPASQIPADQMQYAFMTAAAKANAGVSGDAVELDFMPGFTAFEFQITAQDATQFHKLEIVSSSTALAGACGVSYGTGVTPTYSTSSTTKMVTVNFPNDATAKVAANGNIKFRVFALPQDLTDLTLKFYLSAPDDSDVRMVYLDLKYGTNPPTGHTTGEFLTFDKCKMHVFKALTTPRATHLIQVNSQVVDWVSKGSATIDVIP